MDFCLFGTINGYEWSEDTDNWLGGGFSGVWFAPVEGSDNIRAGDTYGGISGEYIEVGEGTGTWQAVGVGEWVEVTDLLDPDTLGFDMDDLQKFVDNTVSVPITETYAGLLTGSNDFINTAMSISLYNDWLWTALIYGEYSEAVDIPADWTVTVGESTEASVTLSGTAWDEGEWLADVAGMIDGNNITGAAGGTYDNGELEGIGAGTVVQPAQALELVDE